MKKSISSEEAKRVINKGLKGEKNIKYFCQKHELCYNNVLEIKNAKRVYPELTRKLLSIFLEKEVMKEVFFTYNVNK